MFVSDGFVLGTDLFQDSVQVLLGCGIYLHVDCASELRAQCCQLLKNQGEKKSALRSICFKEFCRLLLASRNHYSSKVCITHLSVILLEVGQLILQALDLHLQVGLRQGGLVQEAAEIGDVSLDRLAHHQLMLESNKIERTLIWANLKPFSWDINSMKIGGAYLVLKSSAASLELSIWSRMLALPMVAAAIFSEKQQELVRSLNLIVTWVTWPFEVLSCTVFPYTLDNLVLFLWDFTNHIIVNCPSKQQGFLSTRDDVDSSYDCPFNSLPW